LGTGDAIIAAENYLKEKFLVLNGDDFYEDKDIRKCLSKFPAILVKEVENPLTFGVIVPEKNWVKEIVEKSDKPPSNLVNAGSYFIPKTILKEKIEESPRGEYEITDYIRKLAKKTKVYFFKAKNWIPLSFAWDLFNINEYLLKNIKTQIKGKIEKNCHIKPPLIIEQGTIVKSGAYIEGPVYIGKNCQIGPNCYIRPYTSIEDNCHIGQAVEIKNSIISQNSHIAHLSYVADSIIGENCNLGAGTILANLRFDAKNVHSVVKGKLIDTQRKKFGAVLGNGVKTGINVSIMPGVLVGQNSIIGPHSLVKENIKDNQVFYTKYQTIVKNKKI
jgi:bifunctional UDP-N-acetylglucosamine pyrophosphorylase/glucosamine-1-phosphate N-acetyltransferase